MMAILILRYKIPSGQETSGMEYSWYAVLVWVGKKPSPKFCAGKDLLRNPFAPQVLGFFRSRSFKGYGGCFFAGKECEFQRE